MSTGHVDVSTQMESYGSDHVASRILDTHSIKSAVSQHDEFTQLEIISEMFTLRGCWFPVILYTFSYKCHAT